ncbi:transglycosylase domain-containing protein [Anaerosphaera multitolerans]|uniref:Penicillin-binding protein n=1 Tax=Anaerosphaera multitolerans TaxID=2487351 RepID=A0A437S839_9FIRM|nr:transglycosylase domain-containing protein [Anaerosphaera multitolerans]RVU54997.1 penicillin-binding protein [Anaerosphaera multitolerans]
MEKIKKLDKKDKLKLVSLIFLIFLTLIGTFVASIILSILSETPNTDFKDLTSSFDQTSYIYDRDGKLLEKIESVEYRTLVPLEKVPEDLKNAFVAIEDQRFFNHKGVDIRGILGAVLDNISAGKVVRGGSTITQQLVKNVYLTNVQSLSRKIQEAYMSLHLETVLNKDEILEAYLNRINLGQGAYGVEAAAQTYFSKDVQDLNLAQCALLAGIAKSPTIYPPFKRIPKDSYNNEPFIATRDVNGEQMYLILNTKAFERQEIVLNKMLELNYIDEKQYKEAMSFDTLASLNPGIKKFHSMSSYSTDYIKAEASRLLAEHYNISADEAEHKLFTGGYKVYSSIDEEIQRSLEDIYSDFPSFLNNNTSSNQGAYGLSISKDSDDNIIDDNGEIVYFKRDNFFDEDFNFTIDSDNYNLNSKGDLSISRKLFNTASKRLDIIDLYEINDNKNLQTYNIGFLNLPDEAFQEKNDYIIIDHNYFKNNGDFYKIDDESNLIISKEYYSYESEPTLQPQSSSIVIENDTGYVKAIVGGLDINNKAAKIFNRATDSVRSPGSLLKPLVYLTALENQYTLGSVTDEVPIYNNDGEMWPINDYKGFKGLLTIRMALENNSSVVPVKIAENLGIDKIKSTYSDLGIINDDKPLKDNFVSQKENKEKNDENFNSLVLGNMERGITNIQAASSYRTIASKGDTKQISSVIKIEDANGTEIVNNYNLSSADQKFDPINCYLIEDALRSNVTRGFAKGAKLKNIDTAGEIGINEENSDLWFTGFNSKYTISTWMGCDSPKVKLNAEPKIMALLFRNISSKSSSDIEFKKFEKSDEIVEKYICQKSGNLGSTLCEEAGEGYVEMFKKGTEPTKYCKQHEKLLICNESSRLAGEYCPKEDVEYKILFEREGSYKASEHSNLYPDDYEYFPKLYCNVHSEEWYEKESNN